MNEKTKKWIYRVGYLLLTAGGIALSVFRILPVHNTAMLLVGLMWFWNGLTLLLGVNTSFGKGYCRRAQLWLAANYVAFGAVWAALSMTAYAAQGLPLLLTTAPFLAVAIFLDRRYRKKDAA